MERVSRPGRGGRCHGYRTAGDPHPPVAHRLTAVLGGGRYHVQKLNTTLRGGRTSRRAAGGGCRHVAGRGVPSGRAAGCSGMTMPPLMPDPKRDLAGATPETLARALLRRVEPLRPRPEGEGEASAVGEPHLLTPSGRKWGQSGFFACPAGTLVRHRWPERKTHSDPIFAG